jgi:hypothetical protein
MRQLRMAATLAAMYLPAALLADAKAPAQVPATMQSVDQQITELQKQRRQCKLQAELAKREADRLMPNDWLAYKKALQKEEMMEERMQQIDKEIGELEKKRAKSS